MKNRIKALREEKHLSQRELSILLGVTQETVSSYESGRHLPSIPRLIQLSEILDASCDYILGLSNVRDFNHSIPLSYDESLILIQYRHLADHKKRRFMKHVREADTNSSF